jgi:hypothetical protein
MLTGSSGSTASIVRFPYLYQLAETEDFLWSNTDVAIWSIVEVGMGVTASSLATLRPLFISFLSKSRSKASTYPRNTPRLRSYIKKTSRDDLELRSDFGKSIRVTTTVVNSESASVRKNQEVYKRSCESETALKEDSKWSSNLEADCYEDVGRGTFIEGGVAA